MYEYTIKEITRIVDGDTLDIVFDLGFSMFTKQRVRLNRIDTPETNSKDALEHKLGIEVKEFVAMWCASQDIMRIKTSKDDKYGRMLADIYGKDDICLNDLLVTSGYRSNEKQKSLFDQMVAKLGGDKAAAKKKVAEPMPPLGQGKGSFHLKGLAIDINSKGADGLNALAGPRDKPTGWLESFGLTRPVVGEDWHVQATGLAPTPDNPVNPGSPTLVAGKDGKPTNLATGKSESLPVEATSSSSGTAVASASTEVAAGQRAQQKPSTPVIINAPTTTTTTVVKNESVRNPNEKVADTNQTLLARAT